MNPDRACFKMQRPPHKFFNGYAFQVNTAVDGFVNVTGWRNFAFDDSFFYAGRGGTHPDTCRRRDWRNAICPRKGRRLWIENDGVRYAAYVVVIAHDDENRAGDGCGDFRE
ncbi:MAG: hypothetical protein LBO04_05045 [Spirochaetaceae bacterium]|nr:hypothetical protein [Spirochaetaceae bacterium]